MLGLGEAKVFSNQLNKIPWQKSSPEEIKAYLKKLYRIVKGCSSQQENLSTEPNNSFEPLFNATDSSMETAELPETDIVIDVDKNQK